MTAAVGIRAERYVRHPFCSTMLLVRISAALCPGNALSGIAPVVPVAVALG
jgi:hypothetical protein